MKRPIMYSLTIICLFVSLSDATQITGSLQTYILQRHNDARSAVRNCQAVGKNGATLPPPKSGKMNDLAWSTKLARSASDYAETCGSPKMPNEYCIHSSKNNWPSGGYSQYGISGGVGENIGCPWGGVTAIERPQAEHYFNLMIDSELKQYSYLWNNHSCWVWICFMRWQSLDGLSL
eukprot:278029_1